MEYGRKNRSHCIVKIPRFDLDIGSSGKPVSLGSSGSLAKWNSDNDMQMESDTSSANIALQTFSFIKNIDYKV